MNNLTEDLEDIEDTRVLNMLRGINREKKMVPRFRDRMDMKRFKDRGYSHETIINGTAIEIKE